MDDIIICSRRAALVEPLDGPNEETKEPTGWRWARKNLYLEKNHIRSYGAC